MQIATNLSVKFFWGMGVNSKNHPNAKRMLVGVLSGFLGKVGSWGGFKEQYTMLMRGYP